MEVVSIILRVENLERSVAFWSEIVGLATTTRFPGFATRSDYPVRAEVAHLRECAMSAPRRSIMYPTPGFL
jgi:catechol 2,3-dioxygenase-like lactoylglutathione lyase family enzyme